MGRFTSFIKNPFQTAISFYLNYAVLTLLNHQLVPEVARGFINPAFNFLLPIIMLEPLISGFWTWRTGKQLSASDENSVIALRVLFMAIPLILLDKTPTSPTVLPWGQELPNGRLPIHSVVQQMYV
ncbi:MAG: hypothetical protein NUV85_03140, partial [Candidatus Berkelbacteria bacterium]|nr:hypothetical protein [Candidatus Berkelbacteria bacterium]